MSMCMHSSHTQDWYHHQEEFLLQALSCVWPSPTANIQQLFLSPSGQKGKGKLDPGTQETFYLCFASIALFLSVVFWIHCISQSRHSLSARVYCVHSNTVGSWAINPRCSLGVSLRIILPKGEVSDLY